MKQRVHETADEAPPVDPEVVHRAYRRHRAARQARIERTRAAKRAGFRFWVVLVLLLAGAVALAVVFWRQVEQLFGL